jgi:hypothetical protein
VNLLDENVPESERRRLLDWRVRVRQIGVDVGYQGLKDDQIVPLLITLRRVTFFSLDSDYYKPHLRHADYSLVFLAVGQYQTAEFVRRFLRHPAFDTLAKRLGKVIRLSPAAVHFFRLHGDREEAVAW